MRLHSAEPPRGRRIVRGRERHEASLTGNGAGASIDQSSPRQRASKMWLDECLEGGVRIADPAYIRGHVEWRAERHALLVGYQNAVLTRDQLRAEIVRVAAERGPTGTMTFEERSEISDEAIVARHQLVELAAARDVLVLERLRFTRLWRPTHRCDHFIINRCELGSIARKEPRNHGKAVSQGRRGRRMENQRNDFARESVDAHGRRSLAANGPELVRQMLLDERNLRLHRELDICQRARARTARDTGQD